MESKPFEKYFFFILLAGAFVFSLAIFQPFWIVLLLGVSFAIVLNPIYEWFKNKKFPNWLASFITVLIFILIILGLIFGMGVMIVNQSKNFYNTYVTEGNFEFIAPINEYLNRILPEEFSFNLNEKVSDVITMMTRNIADLFKATFSAIFTFFLTALSIFYFLKDSEKWRESIKMISPLSLRDNEKLMDKFSLSIKGILGGYFVIAFVQGTLISIGFGLFGVPNPVLWGTVAMVASFVPTVGTGLVTIPAVIFLLISGDTMQAIGLFIWAVAMVGTIDNILNPVIVGNKIKLHPLLILFSALGGMSVFGPAGILVGPLAVSLLYTLISMYRSEFRQNNQE